MKRRSVLIGLLAVAFAPLAAKAAFGPAIAISPTLSASTGPTPPAGYIFLADVDGSLLIDVDGAYLMERA